LYERGKHVYGLSSSFRGNHTKRVQAALIAGHGEPHKLGVAGHWDRKVESLLLRDREALTDSRFEAGD